MPNAYCSTFHGRPFPSPLKLLSHCSDHAEPANDDC
jgi:hypothetical protein